MTDQPEDNDTPDMTPEEAAEFEKAFLDWVLIGECKAEIHELKNLKPTTITERMQANQELEKLEAKLAERLEHVTDLAGHEAKSAPQPASAAPPEVVLMPSQAAPTAPAVAAVAAVAESWHLKKPERAHGYTWELYSVLKAARDSDKPCPKARDVLDSWKANKQPNIPEVMNDEFKHLDSNGNTKTVSIDSLRKAIDRMTTPDSAR